MKQICLPKFRTSFILLIVILISAFNVNAQYCTPAPSFGCLTGDYPSQFSMTGTSSSINDPVLTCSPSGSSGFGGYEDRTAETCAVASPSVVNCSIMSNIASHTGYTTTSSGGTTPTSTNENCQIWVDWDNSGVFDATESIGGMSLLDGTLQAFTCTIPSGIASGYYRMRLAVSSGGVYPNMDPCLVTTIGPFSLPYGSGDAIDYTIYVGVPCPPPTALTLGASTCTSQIVNWTAAAGATGYEWVVDNSASAPTGAGVATATTTFTATGLTAGTNYYAHVRTNCGGGSFSSWVTLPFTTAGPGPITGTAATCPGSTTALSDAIGGGTWSSSATPVATVSASGVVYGVSTGTTNISYTVGGCSVGIAVNVANVPALVGTMNVCPGGTTQLSDALPGGTWSSGTGSVATVSGSGLVYGVNPGTSVITYTRGGCSATATVTVSSLPAITGGNSVCVGSTINLSDATGGGVWSSSNTTNATVSTTGVVSGAAVGNTVITYALGSCSVTTTVTVGNAIAAITGTNLFCVTSQVNLSDATAGGTWSSSNNAVATVSGTVTVHGASAGTATISYNIGGCSATYPVTVDPNNAGTISGKDSICKGSGHVITLSDNISGGTWSSATPTKATVDPVTGVVTAIVNGAATATINYVVTNTCGTFTATYVVHIRTSAQCLTGMNPIAEEGNSKLQVFPNPNSGVFTMKLVSDIDEEVNVVITNIVGEKVKQFKTTTNNLADIKLGAAGIYLLSATTDHGNYVVKVVVDK
jgi:hypothetical protein